MKGHLQSYRLSFQGSEALMRFKIQFFIRLVDHMPYIARRQLSNETKLSKISIKITTGNFIH